MKVKDENGNMVYALPDYYYKYYQKYFDNVFYLSTKETTDAAY